MHVLIGDIGNTVTKLCLVDSKNFKLKKTFYFNSNKINLNHYLIKNFNQFTKNKLCIIEGRDIGTVITPKADLKLFF